MNSITETASHAKPVTDQSFDDEVLKSPQPVLVDFWAAWCGPCRMIGPIVEQLALDFAGRAIVAKVDVDANPDLSARFRVSSIPTLLIFKNGAVVEQVVGAVSKRVLTQKLAAHLS